MLRVNLAFSEQSTYACTEVTLHTEAVGMTRIGSVSIPLSSVSLLHNSLQLDLPKTSSRADWVKDFQRTKTMLILCLQQRLSRKF